MSGRRSERIKTVDSHVFEDKSEDEWSDETDTDTNGNDTKVSKENKENKTKQIRLITKSAPSSATGLQIKLKMPSKAPAPPLKKKKTEEKIRLPKDMDPEPVCPICLKIIIGDLDDINEHVDECIGPSPSASSNVNSGTVTPVVMEESTKLQRSLSLVNVDEDDFGYGKSQYTESDVENTFKLDNQKKLRATFSSEEQETKNSLLIQSILGTTSPSPDFQSLQLALRSLLDRIAAAPKCAVCWETLKMPAVTSVNCWHVCCEVCWLRTLGTKRLCPHCSCITNPSDLRKVYF
jgi:hypothetical protein